LRSQQAQRWVGKKIVRDALDGKPVYEIANDRRLAPGHEHQDGHPRYGHENGEQKKRQHQSQATSRCHRQPPSLWPEYSTETQNPRAAVIVQPHERRGSPRVRRGT